MGDVVKKPKRRTIPVSAARWISQRAAGALDPLIPGERLTWGRPETRVTDTATFTTWRTLCNSYMISRVVSKYSDDHRFNAYRSEDSEQFLGGYVSKEAWEEAGCPKKYLRHDVPLRLEDTGRPKDLRNIFKAMEIVEEYHKEKYGISELHGNDSHMMAYAAEHGLDTLPGAGPIRRNGATTVASAGPKAEKRPRAPRVSTGPLDALGSREGSGDAQINKAITHEPKSMKQLMADAGVDRSYYNHVNKLLKDGKIERTPQGYKLKEKS